MLLESVFGFSASLAQAIQTTSSGRIFHPPEDVTTNIELILRWLHFIAGVTWIGHLYFFNFVNGPFVKTLDAGTKKIVVPQLAPRALFWFRWGAMLTFLSGWAYALWKVFIAADAGEAGVRGDDP